MGSLTRHHTLMWRLRACTLWWTSTKHKQMSYFFDTSDANCIESLVTRTLACPLLIDRQASLSGLYYGLKEIRATVLC